jgi:methylamine--corrinoid protein Co-methyltransferase
VVCVVSFLEVLDRAHSGPVCEVEKWDKHIIPTHVKEKLREHGLTKTCDPANSVNTDDTLADEFWKAGFEFAADTGMLCLDTERTIKFTEEELKEAIRYQAPSEITIGEGTEKLVVKARKPEDPQPPLFRSGFGVVSEEHYMELMQAMASLKIIDLVTPLTTSTLHGRPILAGSPYESLAGINEAAKVKEALRRAGRLGAPIIGVALSPTEYGLLGGYGALHGYARSDMGLALAVTELKTSYGLLHKVVRIQGNGSYIYGGHWSMIGGYVGPPEGAALAAVAAVLLQLLVHRCALISGVIYDVRYGGNVGRDALWAASVAEQAVSRNTHLLIGGVTSQVSGPCTREVLYEMAAGALEQVASGCAVQCGNRSAGGKHVDHITPLEQKFAAEVSKSCAGMKRTEANDVVKAILPRYEEKLRNPPLGKTFMECYNLKTLKPTEEWLSLYREVKRQLADLGVPLQA